MKRIIYSLMAMLLVFTGSLQAQTKAIPDDPTVPHFVKLEVNDPAGGTFTGTAEVAGIGTIDIMQGVSTDLPNATIVKVIAKPNEGWKIDRITEQLSGQEELDLGKTDIETGYESSFELTDNRTLKAYFIQIGSYSVKYDLENLKVTPEKTSVEEGEPLTVTLVPNETYFLLPDHIRVTMGDPNNVLSDEVYDAKTGKITIPNVTGNIEITAEAIDNRYYTVTVNAEHLTYDKDAIKPVKAGYPLNTIIFTPEEGYKLPTTVMVTMGGQELVNNKDYAYDPESGALEVHFVTGDVIITITAISLTEVYDITYESDPLNFHYDTEVGDGLIPPTVVAGAPLKVLLVPDAGYVIPEANVTVTMGGKELSGVYSLSEDFRVGEIYIESVMGDVTISVVAKMLTFADIFDDSELDGEILIEEVPMIKLYQELTLTLSAAEGYHLPETIGVEMNGELLAEGEGYTYNSETGELVIKSVEGIIKIIAQAEPDEPKPDPDPDPEDPDDPDPTPTPDPDPDEPDVPTATADISGDVVKVWAANGVLHIHTPQPATVRVVSFSGALFRLMDVPGGDVQFTLPDNLYIVTVGDEVKKIKVR